MVKVGHAAPPFSFPLKDKPGGAELRANISLPF